MPTINSAELTIAYTQTGNGPPLILLHGALSDSRAWHHQLDAFADEFTVVAWDAPGCGHSDDPPESFRLPEYADCLAALIETLGLDRPHLLGLSFGGGLAVEFYRRYPTIPQSLILASAYAGWAGSLPADVVAARLQNGLAQSTWPPQQVVASWLPTLLPTSTPSAVVAETSAIMAEFHPVGMRVMLQAFAEADLRGVLPTITVPTLLLYGDADQRSPKAVADYLHATIPDAQLCYLPGVGHIGNVEAPDVFNTAVRNFLSTMQKETDQ